jgi:hypothetical protein
LGGSVNALEWCPEQFGMRLVAGCSNGEITMFTKQEFEDTWLPAQTWNAHEKSVNALAWAPNYSLETKD